MNTHPEVVYSINADDSLVEVNEAWTEFALQNQGTALLPPAVYHRSIWDFVTERTTRHLYRELFELVRGGAPPIRFSFRCDSPTIRRELEMTLSALPSDGLEFRVRTLAVEERTGILILEPRARRSKELLRMCSWCKRIPDWSGKWVEIEEALSLLSVFECQSPPAITHTICEDCHREISRGLEDPNYAASGEIRLGALGAA